MKLLKFFIKKEIQTENPLDIALISHNHTDRQTDSQIASHVHRQSNIIRRLKMKLKELKNKQKNVK